MPIEYLIINILLATAIGGTTVYIAYQQYTLNRIRLNNERYDRRIIIYRAIKEYFDHVLMEGTTYFFNSRKLYTETAEADFILGDESKVRDYIEALYKKGVQLSMLNKKLYTFDNQPNFKLSDQESSKLNDEHDEILDWFVSEESKLKNRFSQYMKLE